CPVTRAVDGAGGGVGRRLAVPGTVLEPAAFCFLNPGSVGQPRDGDERAAYAVFDSETYPVWFHRVAYDVRRITRENARRGIRIGPRAAQGQSLMSRLLSSVPRVRELTESAATSGLPRGSPRAGSPEPSGTARTLRRRAHPV